MLNFFGPKLYGLGVWAKQNSYLEEKNTDFSQKWIFVGRCMHISFL